jgi:signal transduction histidine kinase/CheY-like chemotaxis protein
MKLKSVLLIICTCFYLVSVSSQEKKDVLLDSIFKAAKKFNENYDYKSSIETAHRLIEAARKKKNNKYLAKGYNTMGYNNEMLFDSTVAISNYKKALYYAKKAKDDGLISTVYNNLANIYAYYDYDSNRALKFYRLSNAYAKKTTNVETLLSPVLNIGWTYIDEKKYDSAIAYLKEAEKLIAKSTDTVAKIQIRHLLGDYHTNKTENYALAEKYFKESIAIGDPTKYNYEKATAYFGLSNLYKKTKRFEEAINHYLVYDSIIDIASEEDTYNQAALASAKFAAEDIKSELDDAKSASVLSEEVAEKTRYFAYAATFAVIVLLALVVAQFYNQSYRKKLTEALRLKNERLLRTSQEARELAEVKTKFLSTVSHELRTPLYGIVGLTNILMDDKQMSKESKEHLSSLKFSGDYLINLINDVLQLSKIESNKVKLQNNSFNIRDLIFNIKHSFEHQLTKKNNTLHINIDAEVPEYLIGDSVRLSQILINLVGNAVKFTNNGAIHIILKAKEVIDDVANIEFVIEDEGEGIPEEMQRAIFDNFTQLERKANDYQGTGLGLAIVQKLIKLFNTTISLKSKVGEGSTFIFSIPFAVDSNMLTDTCEINQDKRSKNAQNLPLLVVEDNKINQIVTRKVLEREGFAVSIAEDGEEAISLAKQNKYSLVLMDLNMPKMNGYQASKIIRSFNAKIPIVALTAVEITEVKEKVLQAGINDIVVKPYDEKEFFQTIYKHLSNIHKTA